jgi:KaiC/GvpD/RAD55 family RecA-like ATPase
MAMSPRPTRPTKYLPTGISALNAILSMDDIKTKPEKKGLLIGKGKMRSELETPIILITGSTGTGKTTLALQIAFQAARDNWVPCFYALEQTALSLSSLAADLDYFKLAHQAKERDKERDNPVVFCVYVVKNFGTKTH